MDSHDFWPSTANPLSKTEEAELVDFLQPLFGGQLALNQLPT